MLFNSPEFLFAFFPIAFVGYRLALLAGRAAAVFWLGACSLFFYSWWDVCSLPILAVSIATNYCIGVSINRSKGTRGGVSSRALMILGVGVNLLTLGYYKYAAFLVLQLGAVVNLPSYVFRHIELPIGISFFTFTQIAYLVDVYRGDAREYNPIDYALFVSYFPHLIAGPILHHKDMMPQFQALTARSVSAVTIATGLGILGVGLGKKLLLADPLGVYASSFFNGVATGGLPTFFDSALGTTAYTFQLYFDFSGYSDMAVGISVVFGIVLPVNFLSPYKSRSIAEFWRRWHITLSSFLRDYLYISLGGNRHGSARRYVNLLLTMMLGGIWHGAGWTFLLWGLLHGMYLMINHAWKSLRESVVLLRTLEPVLRYVYLPLTFAAVAAAWIPFRALSLHDAGKVFAGLLGSHGVVLPNQVIGMLPMLGRFVQGQGTVPLLADGTIMGLAELLVLLVVAAWVSFGFRNTTQMSHRTRVTVVALLMPLLLQKIFFGGKVEFLYFQF